MVQFPTIIVLLDDQVFFYKKLRRKVTVGRVSMFVVAGAIPRSGRTGYMKLSSNRRPGSQVALASFSQAVHGLLRGKWQLLGPRVHRCHLTRQGQLSSPPASCFRVSCFVMSARTCGLYNKKNHAGKPAWILIIIHEQCFSSKDPSFWEIVPKRL